MTVIKWEEPKPSHNRRGSGWTGKVLAELQTRPDEWAVVMEVESNLRTLLGTRGQNLQTIAARQGIRIEVAVRTEAGTTRLYARFVTERKES